MNDQTLLNHITQLVEEEHTLRAAPTSAGAEAERLRHVAEQLDQCWDLLRQRRAKREFGENPSEAHVRDVGTVKRYEG
ncbi:DUF2630 family protein [Ideonella azotifigens]|uniref:DUF2630 family protein n=1 Tax=Ideonella azotifigens TaxID=513160 RepID=A0ABP3VPI9_9BURK|nr:DUF2630 family protein [Ideonella azotifigens]MCD2340781.1 DUF2630 family protein [Ideonella azotifigens]